MYQKKKNPQVKTNEKKKYKENNKKKRENSQCDSIAQRNHHSGFTGLEL